MQSLYKVALITGASSGIGAATAQRLAKQGLKLILLARREDRLVDLKEELSHATQCHIIVSDVRDHKLISTKLAELPGVFRDIDILVNNAGLALGMEPAQVTLWEDWQQMIDTNCTALAFLTRQLLPGMVERNRGHIINIGSVAGDYAYPGGNAYGATKAFVERFSLNLKADLLGSAVRVTNIEPGITADSEFSLVRFHGDSERANKVYENIEPLLAEDIAEAVGWAIDQPAHVNINRIEMMPACQAAGPLAVYRKV